MIKNGNENISRYIFDFEISILAHKYTNWPKKPFRYNKQSC